MSVGPTDDGQEIVRFPGQSPLLAGAIRAENIARGSLVVTSGVISPRVLAELGAPTAPSVPFPEQAADVLSTLMTLLADAGAGPESVIRLEAFLRDAGDFAAWNQAYQHVWRTPGPTRTTLVAEMVDPAILIEVQAIAIAR